MISDKDKPKVSSPSLPTPGIDDRNIPIRWAMKNGVSDYQRERRLIEIRKASTESKGWRTVHIDKTHRPRAGRTSSRENACIWKVPCELTQEPTRPSSVGKTDSVDVVARAQDTRLDYGR